MSFNRTEDSKIDDGGAAFAAGAANDHTGWTQEGMSLRDWFAGQALSGLLASGMTYGGSSTNRRAVALDAFAHADAMITARKARS